ncbi:MAG: alpha/beta hydrolase [Fidelibacterota bacterium]|nr:MAG: alpha/beta hydrolase [Candidatus Neomarinimicrobiota bacterium]
MLKTKYILIICLAVVVLFGVKWCRDRLSAPGTTPPITGVDGQSLPGSIASLERIDLGGVQQWILLRGANIDNPVILFLHGGPGAADMTLLPRHMGALEEHFVVVCWDQRGAGKSFPAARTGSDMTINRFVADVLELTELLCRRFQQEKIYLVGQSWGSIIGVLSVQRNPGRYHAYIGIGQVVNGSENERLSYEWTLAQALASDDTAAVETLQDIGPLPYEDDLVEKLFAQRELLGKYGGSIYGNPGGAHGLFIAGLQGATEYNTMDKINFIRGLRKSLELLWPQVLAVNFIEQAPVLEVPVYLLMGRHDYQTPFALAEQYVDLLEAPRKELIWFDHSAHMPHLEEPDKFSDLLINHILPATCCPDR